MFLIGTNKIIQNKICPFTLWINKTIIKQVVAYIIEKHLKIIQKQGKRMKLSAIVVSWIYWSALALHHVFRCATEWSWLCERTKHFHTSLSGWGETPQPVLLTVESIIGFYVLVHVSVFSLGNAWGTHRLVFCWYLGCYV